MSTTPTADRIADWLTKHYTLSGAPYTLTGRDWVMDELLIPITSFRYWPRSQTGTLCKACRKLAGTYQDWDATVVKRLNRHARTKCVGLRLVAPAISVYKLQRGAGKSINTMSTALALCEEHRNFEAGYVAVSEDQTKLLVGKMIIAPIGDSPYMSKHFAVRGGMVTRNRRGKGDSHLEFTSTSFRSITGRRRDLNIIDEARDWEARTFTALVMSAKARARFVCPRGHEQKTYAEDICPRCSVCRADMYPIIPRIVVMSSAGALDGSERGHWYSQLVESLQRESQKYAHLYIDANAANPDIATVETEALEEVLLGVDALTDYMSIELFNQDGRVGDDFLSTVQLGAICDESLEWSDGSLATCVAYLDTSRTGDLTSLVIIGQDIDNPKFEPNSPWRWLRWYHLNLWDPAKENNHRIDRGKIEAYLALIMPLFPNCVTLQVDVRGRMQWAVNMVDDYRTGRIQNVGSWSSKVIAHAYGQRVERRHAWACLESVCLDQLLRIPAAGLTPLTRDLTRRVKDEVKGATRITLPDNTTEIRDRDRRTMHVEAVEGAAWCMSRIHTLRTQLRSALDADTHTGLDTMLQRVFADTGGKIDVTSF